MTSTIVKEVSENDTNKVSMLELEASAEFGTDCCDDLDVKQVSEGCQEKQIAAPPVGTRGTVPQTIGIKKSYHHGPPYNEQLNLPPDIQRCPNCLAIINNHTTFPSVADNKENVVGRMQPSTVPSLDKGILDRNPTQMQLDAKVASLPYSNQGSMYRGNVPGITDNPTYPEKKISSNSSIKKTLDHTPDRKSAQVYNSSSTLSTNEARLVTPDNLACKKPRRRVRRDLEPQTKEYVEVKSKDVLFGRGVSVGGVPVHDHSGNKKFREEIKKREQRYKKLLQPDKTPFSKEVVQWVKNRDGRFLQFDKDVRKWYIASDDRVLEKVKAALREDYTLEGKQAKKEKKAASRKVKKHNNIKKAAV